jgi:hypothetical protein
MAQGDAAGGQDAHLQQLRRELPSDGPEQVQAAPQPGGGARGVTGTMVRPCSPGLYRPRHVHAIEWLLDSEPAIRRQGVRDLLHEPDDAVAAEHARVATVGWGARLLALQAADGNWGRAGWAD